MQPQPYPPQYPLVPYQVGPPPPGVVYVVPMRPARTRSSRWWWLLMGPVLLFVGTNVIGVLGLAFASAAPAGSGMSTATFINTYAGAIFGTLAVVVILGVPALVLGRPWWRKRQQRKINPYI